MKPSDLAALLVRLFASESPRAATAFLSSSAVTKGQRKELGRIAGLEEAWVKADQDIAGNVEDLADALVDELYKPFWFFRRTLQGARTPRSLFEQQMATRPLKEHRSFWTAQQGLIRYSWLPDVSVTFDAVVHFVQSASGTGVHICDADGKHGGDGGDGRGTQLVLTCAHVIDAQDDEALEEAGKLPKRCGRRKLVMFPSGRTFLCVCVAVDESADGSRDVAACTLEMELELAPLERCDLRQRHPSALGAPSALPAAVIATQPMTSGSRLVCVGNPSSVDLESQSRGAIEFKPPAWHASAGECAGYQAADVAAARATMDARGRPPTRGEVKQLSEARAVSTDEGCTMQHTCWTYWGHSGAPLFDDKGGVCGLHASWDQHTGMRHAQKLDRLHAVVRAASKTRASTPAVPSTAAATAASSSKRKAGGVQGAEQQHQAAGKQQRKARGSTVLNPIML